MDLSRGIVAVLQIIFILQANGYDECKEIGICDSVDDNYPTALAKDLIKELKRKNTLINSDEFEIDLDFRIEDGRQELCNVTKKLLIPTKGIDSNGTMRHIVNDKDNPVQKFNTVICNGIIQKLHKSDERMLSTCKCSPRSDTRPSSIIFNPPYNSESNCSTSLGFIENYKGACIQQFVQREILYINDLNQSATGYFKIPTCCSCKLLRIN